MCAVCCALLILCVVCSQVNVVLCDMAEGGFDPCECVCTHEYAMRRLINLVSPKISGPQEGVGQWTVRYSHRKKYPIGVLWAFSWRTLMTELEGAAMGVSSWEAAG